jgi:hypothetical protein
MSSTKVWSFYFEFEFCVESDLIFCVRESKFSYLIRGNSQSYYGDENFLLISSKIKLCVCLQISLEAENISWEHNTNFLNLPHEKHFMATSAVD